MNLAEHVNSTNIYGRFQHVPSEHFMMEKLKTEKARTKGAFTQTKTKLLMSMEGGLSPQVKVMESLDKFAIAFENIIDACARLQY